MIKVLLNSPLIFFFLLPIYPITFFMSANPTQYNLNEFGFIISLIVAVCIILSFLIEIFYRIFNIKFKKKYVYLALSFLLAFSPMHYVTQLMQPSLFCFAIIYSFLFIAAVFICKKKCMFLNIVLLLVNIFGVLQYSYSIYDSNKKSEECVKFIPKQYSNLKLKSKPNIYYFYMESYHGLEAMKDIFHFDNSEFYSFLKDKNFTIYNNTYSNYNYTFASLLSTFMMTHHFNKINLGNMDTHNRLLDLLSGSSDNIVLNILKNNGYEINYYMGDKILVRRVCYADYHDLNYSIFDILQILGLDKLGIKLKLSKNQLTRNISEQVNKFVYMLESSFLRKKPQFFFVKVGGGVMSYVYHPTMIFEPLLSTDLKEGDMLKDIYFSDYVTRMKNGNKTLMKIINLIIKNDPNSIIILLGDHGSLAYSYLSEKSLELNNASSFNVICAIHFPASETNTPKKELLSNVNLFRYIFSYLSGKNIPSTNNISIPLASKMVCLKDAQTISPIPIDQYINNHKISP